MSSAKSWSFCPGGDELNRTILLLLVISTGLDCFIVPTCAAWGSAKWDYQRPLKTVGIPTVRHQPTRPTMHFKRKFRIVCCMVGVAAIMGMAESMKYIYDGGLVS